MSLKSCISNTSLHRRHFLEKLPALLSEQDIGDMPTRFKTQKGSYCEQVLPLADVDVTNLSEKQLLAYNIVISYFRSNTCNKLLLLVTGVAGTGKSYLIECVKNLLLQSCIVLAFFGVATFNVKGATLHKVL